MAELQYGKIPELEKKLAAAQAAEQKPTQLVRNSVTEEEIAEVVDSLRSGWLTTGPNAAELERRFAEYAGAKHALAVSSGTAAMHLTLVALGIGAGYMIAMWTAVMGVLFLPANGTQIAAAVS